MTDTQRNDCLPEFQNHAPRMSPCFGHITMIKPTCAPTYTERCRLTSRVQTGVRYKDTLGEECDASQIKEVSLFLNSDNVLMFKSEITSLYRMKYYYDVCVKKIGTSK